MVFFQGCEALQVFPLQEGLAAIGAIGWEAIAYLFADGASFCFWRGGALVSGGLCWGLTLAPGRQEEKGCVLPAGGRSPVVGPFL